MTGSSGLINNQSQALTPGASEYAQEVWEDESPAQGDLFQSVRQSRR